MDRVIMGQSALAGDGLDNRNATPGGKGCDGLLGLRIAHTATGDDQRFLGGFQKPCRCFQRVAIGARARDDVDRHHLADMAGGFGAGSAAEAATAAPRSSAGPAVGST